MCSRYHGLQSLGDAEPSACVKLEEHPTDHGKTNTSQEGLTASCGKGCSIVAAGLHILLACLARVTKRSVRSILHFVNYLKTLILWSNFSTAWKVFKPDGVILFSDILTPLSGMNIRFDIVKGKGPVIFNPLRTADDVNQVREFIPEESVPYVGESLTILRKEVDNQAAVLGFVGAPFTLASYCVEGGSSKHFSKIKRLATELSPVDFEEFSLPYLKQIVDTVKATHPNLPLILYASGSGGLLERLALTGVDVVSLDWKVDMVEGRQRLGLNLAVQGNVDPGVLFGSKEFITNRINDVVRKVGKGKHILNLGHGIVVMLLIFLR
ncbi:Uroporphyrinogen decarboxylase [Euphorbia peplus]|nr:Uroporphyrinogen decarboxylase [Euphorbia peplus]